MTLQVFQALTFSYGVLRLSELGNRLKQAREEKKLSLDDLQSITKIQKRYLLAIEEGNYKIIPGNFYIRAFIKQYAEAVNIDPDVIFEEYKNEVPSTYHESLPEQLSRVKTQKELPKSASKFLELLPRILIVIVIVIIAVGFWLWRQSSTPDDSETDTTIVENNNEYANNVDETASGGDVDEVTEDELKENTVTEEDTNELDEETPAQTLTVQGVSGKTTTYVLTGTDKFELEVSAKDRTWVSVKNGKGKTFYGAEIPIGKSEVTDLTAESEITVRVGNVPGTDIKINGELLQYKDTKTTPQNITIIYNKE